MRYEASDQVFVAMPFTKPFQRAYETVIDPAISTVTLNGKKLRAKIINRGTTGSPDIHEEIFHAIIHSRLVIADMTVQSSYIGDDGKKRWHANANVAYEVGLASTWRNPEDILLIHQPHPEHSYGFDIQNLRHLQYDITDPNASRVLSDEIVRAIKQSVFLAHQTYLRILQSASPSAVQYLHSESSRPFPIIAFPEKGMPLLDSRIHAATELLACGALRNRNVIQQGIGKGVAVVYQWTELGLRMLVSMHAIDQDGQKELARKIASVPEGKMPPGELLVSQKSETSPSEAKDDASQKVKDNGQTPASDKT